VTPFEDPWANFVQFLIPALIFGSSLAASQMRMTRTMLLETLRSDYVRTAMA
jgi:peptide/nickel transport system permease protein